MMRSMFAGVSGLRNHQIRMDTLGNNIANVNTVGFKASRVNFQEIFSQTIRGASSGDSDRGGTNPQQVGLGMTVSSIDALHTQGNLQVTGKMTDLAIQGNGLFLLRKSGGHVFTRSGAFDRDADGFLVNPASGLRVQGWVATNGLFPVKDESNLSDIQIAVGQSVPAQATTSVNYANNLSAEAVAGDSFESPVKVYDSLGRLHNVIVTFTKNANPNEWDWQATEGGAPAGAGTITFDATGRVSLGGTGIVAFNPPGANPVSITADFSQSTQYGGQTTITAVGRDGYPMGSLESYTIDATGTITGVYSNGLAQPLAQVAMALFSNPTGLIRSGENLFEESNNSGLKQVGEPGTGGRGTIAPGNLEMSNVDLSREFTEMIVTQRGFQANSRIITTSDEMLQELVNMRR